MKYSTLLLILFCININTMLYSQKNEEKIHGEIEEITQEETAQKETTIKTAEKIELKIDFPLFDLPYQANIMNSVDSNFFRTYGSLSMNQSLSLTVGAYTSMHYGLKKLYDSLDLAPAWKNIIYYGSTVTGIFCFGYLLPLGYPWMKNEYIRTTTSLYGIHTRNDYWSGFAGVTDAQLSYLKENAPYDFIRMAATGHEAYNIFSDTLIRKYFFYSLDDLSWLSALAATLINFGLNGSQIMINKSGLNNADASIQEKYRYDKDQKDRSLTGFDIVNWCYELFRSGEPYANRGYHPSGDGSIARYISFNQLTNDEEKYLVKQSFLSYLNFVSPLLYGVNAIPLGKSGLEGNFALRHYLTSFGTDITANVFLKKNQFNMAFTYHNYQNYEHYFPAIEAEMVDYPLSIGKLIFFLSPRVLIGMQPAGQEFKTRSPEFLGLFGLRVDFMVQKNIFPYLDFAAKTDGWVAGNEYLDKSVSVRLGISLRF